MCIIRDKKKIIQAILMESNYLPQNVRARRKAGNKTSPETTGNRRTNGQRAIRVEQETDTREYLAKCQRARYYNKHDIKILNQSLRFSEVFQQQRTQHRNLTLEPSGCRRQYNIERKSGSTMVWKALSKFYFVISQKSCALQIFFFQIQSQQLNIHDSHQTFRQ